MTNKKHTAIRIDEELKAQATETAKRIGLSFSAFVRLAVIEKMNQINKPNN